MSSVALYKAFTRPLERLTTSTTRPRITLPLRKNPQSCITRSQHAVAESDSRLPRIAQSSLWETIFPKPLRQSTKELLRPSQKRPANPAIYFIWVYVLIGSQAIRILGVKNEFRVYTRQADLKIAKLREVVERLQRGEEVDVEKELGSGDRAQEEEWENALREIEMEEKRWQESKKRIEEEEVRREDDLARRMADRVDASPVNNAFDQVGLKGSEPPPPSPFQTRPGFY